VSRYNRSGQRGILYRLNKRLGLPVTVGTEPRSSNTWDVGAAIARIAVSCIEGMQPLFDLGKADRMKSPTIYTHIKGRSPQALTPVDMTVQVPSPAFLFLPSLTRLM